MRTRSEPNGVIDHEDRDPSNDRWRNLRDITLVQNAANKNSIISKISGYRGVSFHKNIGKLRASLQSSRKRIYLGYFATPEEAHAAYQWASAMYDPRNWF